MSEKDSTTSILSNQEESREISIEELDNVTEIEDNALIIVEDSENTKTMTIDAFRRNLINDAEAPSSTKIYSSEKINELVEDFRAGFNDETAEINNAIEYIKTNYAKSNMVTALVEELENKMATDDDIESVNKLIETKRSKNVPITSHDMDTSTDDNKIKLENLAEEVLSAMAGQTPISLVKSPQGGWTTESIANKAITSDKLSTAYRFKGFYKDGSINDIIEDGVYLIGPGVEDLPKYSDEDEEMKLLYVTLYGNNREYIKQKIEYCYQVEDRPYYVRKGKTASIHMLKFNTIYNITDMFKVTSDLLGDVITDRGLITDGNVFEYTAEGSYKVSKGVTNMPTSDDEYFLTISKHDNYYVYEARLKSEVSCIVYLAYTYVNEYGISITTKWFKITDINKSKFDGQRLHLFGDGICFGLGSSDISKNSYARILYEKYGFQVLNHAINDATAGNYGAKTVEERSILTQIDSTSFEDGDIGIIWVGTNDFKLGSCTIGNNTDMKDTTFKGSLNMAVKKILTKNNSVKLLFVTPMFRSRMSPGDGRNSDNNAINGRYLADYVNAMIDISTINHIPYLDMHNHGMINQYNADRWLSDGLYLSDAGHEMFATRLFDTLSYLY